MLSPRLIGSCILIIDISCFLYLEFLKEITIFSPPLYWPDFYGNFGKSIHEGHCGLAIFSQKWKHKFLTETTHLGEKNSILQRFRQKSFVKFKRQVKRKLLFSLYVQTIPWDDTCLQLIALLNWLLLLGFVNCVPLQIPVKEYGREIGHFPSAFKIFMDWIWKRLCTVYIWSHITAVFCGEGIFDFSSSGSLNIFFCKFKVEI